MSIPLIMLTMVEQQIFLALNGGSNGGAGNSGGLSSILIRLDCAWLLLLMGIQVRAEFMGESLSRPAMLLFTHVSTLDAVVILGTLPRALCAVVKVKEESWGGCLHTYTLLLTPGRGGGDGGGSAILEERLQNRSYESMCCWAAKTTVSYPLPCWRTCFVHRRHERCAGEHTASSFFPWYLS